jgi:anti-anti-sigma regulatory factor
MRSLSIDERTITVWLSPDASVAQVRIVGAIDLAAEAALTEAAEQLRVAASRTVLVDVAGVTFACSTLINFLARVHNGMPQEAHLVIRKATPLTRRLLALARFESIIVMDDGPSAVAV